MTRTNYALWKYSLLIALVLGATACSSKAPSDDPAAKRREHSSNNLQKLRVSDNGRFLVREDGTPFFWLNDTAWYLPNVGDDDVLLYLSDRANKQFTSIMFTCADQYYTYN